MHLRLDAADTWRRTHGQDAIEHFMKEIMTIATEAIPAGGCVVRKGEEATAIATGDRTFAAEIAHALRSHTFTHANGNEALVSAGMGVAEETEDSMQVHVERAVAASSEAGRRVHGGFAVWEPGGLRHVRPVELLS